MNKVFGIGLCKTGTTSLCKAMTILGFKSKHYLSNVDKDIMSNDFVNDMPIQTRYKIYDQQYPNSKFILTVRDKNSWLISCQKQFGFSPIKNRDSIIYKYRVEQMGMDTYNKEVFSKKYDEHLSTVLSYFYNRLQDILIINICNGEGWEKLCPFVNKSIPEIPFPYINKN